MSLQISEFKGRNHVNVDGGLMQVVGVPTAVTTASGAFTARSDTRFIRINGSGTITWANGQAETFSGVEVRAVDGSTAFSVA